MGFESYQLICFVLHSLHVFCFLSKIPTLTNIKNGTKHRTTPKYQRTGNNPLSSLKQEQNIDNHLYVILLETFLHCNLLARETLLNILLIFAVKHGGKLVEVCDAQFIFSQDVESADTKW